MFLTLIPTVSNYGGYVFQLAEISKEGCFNGLKYTTAFQFETDFIEIQII